MVITFYNTASDYRVLDKVLGTSTGSATGHLHERVSDTQIRVKIPGTLFNVVTQSNYAMVDTFRKYYYRRSFEVENDCVIVNLFEDVRKTFATQIKGITATVQRNASMSNGYLKDSGYNALSYEAIQYKKFPNALNDATCIMVTVG